MSEVAPSPTATAGGQEEPSRGIVAESAATSGSLSTARRADSHRGRGRGRGKLHIVRPERTVTGGAVVAGPEVAAVNSRGLFAHSPSSEVATTRTEAAAQPQL